ncbi:MAG: transcription antitermination factor NusB [Candidatus Bipolaricaulia bacterium]
MKRRTARESALKILFQKEFCDVDLNEVRGLEDQAEYVRNVITAIDEHRIFIDKLISQTSINWRLDRMAIVDRNILRLGVCEILFIEGVPIEVAINEAVNLAKKYSTDEAAKFVNGILDRIWREHAPAEKQRELHEHEHRH